MKLEQQLTSLDLSKALKEVGVPQESLFYWWGNQRGSGHPSNPMEKLEGHKLVGGIIDPIRGIDYSQWGHSFDEKYSAFSVAELGEVLKATEKISLGWGAHTEWNEIYQIWECYLINDNCEDEWAVKDGFEANARAKMILYLVREGLLKF